MDQAHFTVDVRRRDGHYVARATNLVAGEGRFWPGICAEGSGPDVQAAAEDAIAGLLDRLGALSPATTEPRRSDVKGEERA